MPVRIQCQACMSERILDVYGKTTDMFVTHMLGGPRYEGYPPDGLNLTPDNDGIGFMVCLDCGQIQGQWPVPRCVAVEGVTP